MNEYLPRFIESCLLEWDLRQRPKPLLLRGPRQVGKSTLVRAFGRRFDYFVELNLEFERDRQYFDPLPRVDVFLRRVFAKAQIRPPSGATILLFVDEIQQEPKAIQFLRYLYEDQSSVRVIAAGSLLKFAMGEVRSLPVGRIEFLSVHPLSFAEYLTWTRQEILADALKEIPAPSYLHGELMSAFRDYSLVGGMPQIVQAIRNGTELHDLARIYQSIWGAYQRDLERHARTDGQRAILRFLITAAPLEHERFKYEGFGGSTYRSRDVREALEALEMARVLRIVRPTSSMKPPPFPKSKARPRLQFLDTGLLNHATELHNQTAAIEDLSTAYRGYLALHVVTQELIASREDYEYTPFFWVRENAKANAEVDLLIRSGMRLLGFEVKSGPQGRLRSLHQYVERSGTKIAVRALDNAASVEDVATPAGYAYRLLNIPLYAAAQVEEYLAWAEQASSPTK